MYTATVLEHFHNPRRCGPLIGATHVGTAGTPGDGPFVTLWFRLADGIVMDAAYKTWGCPAAVACASLIAELAPGRSPKVLLSLTPADIDRLAGGLPEGRAHCPALTMEAVKQALDTAQSGERTVQGSRPRCHRDLRNERRALHSAPAEIRPVTPADLDIPDIPKDLICPVSALVRSALYLDSFAASLASGSTFGELIAADDGTTLELATDVVQRWARQLEIDR